MSGKRVTTRLPKDQILTGSTGRGHSAVHGIAWLKEKDNHYLKDQH